MAHPPMSSLYTMSSLFKCFPRNNIVATHRSTGAATTTSTHSLLPTFDRVCAEGPLPTVIVGPHHSGPPGGPRLPLPPCVKLYVYQGTAGSSAMCSHITI
jgi:hypothetical protein